MPGCSERTCCGSRFFCTRFKETGEEFRTKGELKERSEPAAPPLLRRVPLNSPLTKSAGSDSMG